jgi:hypothetical protein
MPGLPPRSALAEPRRSASDEPPAATAPVRLPPEATVKRPPVHLRALAEAREEQWLTIQARAGVDSGAPAPASTPTWAHHPARPAARATQDNGI